MHSLEDLYSQAILDRSTYRSTTKNKDTFIKYGVMLRKFPNKIELVNCHKGGDYFSPFTEDEVQMFKDNGWKKGVLLFLIKTYKRKLNMIEVRIQQEINGRKNDKYIKGLKVKREGILNKYSIRQKQLTKLN